MSPAQHIEVDLADHARGTVKIDGIELHDVKSVRLSAGVDEANELTLVMKPKRVTVRGPFNVTKEEATDG